MGISYNRIILVGRLTRDPESSYSSSGTHIAKFSMAVDRPVYASSNSSEPGTDFIRVVTFGKTADFVGNYLSKGKLMLVEGRLQISKFQAQDGTTKYFTDVIADKVNFMETKKSTSENYNDDSFQSSPKYSKESQIPENKGESDFFEGPITSNDDDVPF